MRQLAVDAKRQDADHCTSLALAQDRVTELERVNEELSRKLERSVTSMGKSLEEMAAIDVDGLQAQLVGQGRMLDETSVAVRHLRDKVRARISLLRVHSGCTIGVRTGPRARVVAGSSSFACSTGNVGQTTPKQCAVF